MEKTTKKKRSKKGLRKRIGIIAVGGLSLVLTVCLSVGATLAWFAGSTWASKSLYMGGPVYVEMAGRGLSQGTAGDGDGGQTGTDTDKAEWVGGDGNLDIKAAATRTTGTAALTGAGTNMNDILLPGQKVQIYSQARVFSTAETTTVADNAIVNESSGANTTNTSNGVATYQSSQGRVTTTTTSVLRARFSIEVEFDPGMGFNNFTSNIDATGKYMSGYPVQSSSYTGDGDASDKTWQKALEATFSTSNSSTGGTGNTDGTITYTGRRDGVAQPTGEGAVLWEDGQGETEAAAIRAGTVKSIYKWKYVSAAEFAKAGDGTPNQYGQQMPAPFDGTDASSNNGIPFYGVWVTESDGASGYKLSEADAFYKARCNAYLGTYVEFYVNEYGNTVTRTVSASVKALEDKLNEYFVKLVNDSSDAIHDGMTEGFTVSNTDGQITRSAGTPVNASWLYIDPSIGNDTNTDEISTSVGGWWYLVADDGGDVTSAGTGANKIRKTTDSIRTEDAEDAALTATNTITTEDAASASLTRAGGAKDETRLDAMLYEIVPNQALDGEIVAMNGTTEVKKIVSEAFPFVNGSFALPGDALTNLFANAKISFKVAFQALQAFFPYTEDIDMIDYTSALLGNAKALNIGNAIPIFNEAFDYQETNGGTISGL
ncbi:MAG: hypothetical protein E7354_05235 [Clostridiales bacterium]|nr:hypothetical protein [Clostridiales bacterium]